MQRGVAHIIRSWPVVSGHLTPKKLSSRTHTICPLSCRTCLRRKTPNKMPQPLMRVGLHQKTSMWIPHTHKMWWSWPWTSQDTTLTTEEEDASQSQVLLWRRHITQKPKKRNMTNFTEDKEKDLGEWYRENSLFYNKASREYKDTGKKMRLYKEKAQELNCTGMFSIFCFKYWVKWVFFVLKSTLCEWNRNENHAIKHTTFA